MEQKQLRSRSEIPEEFKWRLEDIFPNDEAWEEEIVKTEKELARANEFMGHLGDDVTTFLNCLKWMDEIGQSIGEIYTYARMRRDEDNRNAHYQALTDRAGTLSVKIGSTFAFVVPEILSLPEGTLAKYREENRSMELYDHALNDILRKRAHVLTPAEEKLLAEMGEIIDAPGNIFGMANNADLKFPMVKNEDGQEVELTKGNYIQFMESHNRQVRQEVFTTFYATYKKQINTWASILNSSIKADVFMAKARRYPSAIESSLDDDKVPLTVYDSLIATVREFLPQMHRYVDLRKKALGVEQLHMYDIYVPIVSEVEMKITYPEAVELCQRGLKPLGKEYGKVLEEGFKSRWIDVYENQGKTSGAYSWGTYRSHPYVLLNHQDTLDSMFTLAHEMGHSLHTYFSNQTQPHIYAGYKIFVAEVASTLNEALVMDHLLQTTEEPKLLAYLLNHYLEQFRGTVFRQTMFAEFEKKTHALVEAGEALTAELLSDIYLKLNQDYYGPDVVMDPEIAIEWARIPHFYSAFYVYKYATGFSAATALASRILKEGEPAVKDYIDFLSSGSSDYPIELLRKAGVDMETPTPVRDALQVFTSLIDRLEKLI